MTLAVKNLSYTYMKGTPFEKKALDNIEVTINKGDIVGIIGHTGSGKSTLVQHFNGLLKPTEGSVILDGIEITGKNIKELRHKVGLVFQYPEHQLFEETVYKDIAFGLYKRKLSEDETDVKVRAAIHAVGLTEDILIKSPFELSGGQKRRVAIAGILVLDPDILVLDEPTAGLDPEGRDEIFALIKDLHKKKQKTVVLISHSMEDIAKYVEKVIVMNKGRIEMEGSVAKVFKNSEILESMGLSVPQITIFMKKLKSILPMADNNIFTVNEAKEELKKYLFKQ